MKEREKKAGLRRPLVKDNEAANASSRPVVSGSKVYGSTNEPVLPQSIVSAGIGVAILACGHTLRYKRRFFVEDVVYASPDSKPFGGALSRRSVHSKQTCLAGQPITLEF
jgi:hypothetical protein